MRVEDCLPAELRGATVTPLAGGQSGAAVYRVEAASGTYVLKLHHGPLDEWPGKLAIQRAAAAAGVAPAILHVDEAHRAITSALVVDAGFFTFYGDPTRRAAALAAVGTLLRRVHDLPPPPGAQIRSAREQLELLGRDLGAAPAFVQQAIDRALALDVPQDRPSTLCHNDANPSNLIFDGTHLYLLDWDTAGIHDPLYDLATFAMFLRMDEPTSLQLLSAHDGQPVTTVPPRFTASRRLVAALCGSVLLRMIGAPGAETLDDTISLTELYLKMRTGELRLATPEGRRSFALALCKESLAT